MLISNEEFARLWRNSNSPQDLADDLELTYAIVTSKASRLRRRGYDVPKKLKSKEFMKMIGKKGGSVITDKPKGFAAFPREKVVAAGIKGGRVSRRAKKA